LQRHCGCAQGAAWLQDGGPGRVCAEVVNYNRAFLFVLGPPNTTHVTQEMDQVILGGFAVVAKCPS
jgi:hypothetical protein